MACKGVGVVEEQVSAMQSSKTPAPNSSSADGVDNPPRDPVRHTSVSGHAANLEMMDERGVERETYSKEAPSKSPVVHSSEIMSMLKKLVNSSTRRGLDAPASVSSLGGSPSQKDSEEHEPALAPAEQMADPANYNG